MKLYVGTYAKYNSGSIAGAWLDLDKFANKEEFLKACRRLHKGERDPEFMFQDVEFTTGEDWERNYYDESHIDADYWKEAAEARARRQAEAKKPKKANPVREAYCAEIAKIERSESMRKYYDQKAEVVVKLTGGELVAIEKPSITTSHCEGEDEGMGGPTVAEAQSRCDYFKTERGFKRTNLRAFDEAMIWRVGRKNHHAYGHDYRKAIVCERYNQPSECKLAEFSTFGLDFFDIKTRKYTFDPRVHVIREPNAEDIRRMRQGYMIVRNNFKKRLDAYWKRYGASKLRTWTYWMSA